MNRELLDYLSNKTVLYAEDEEDIRNSVNEILELFFDRVICVENGEDALIQYEEEKPDILILDIYMPKIDGLDVVKKIRETNREIPVILLSAHTEQEYLWRAVEQNITKYLTKPFSKTTLIEALEKITLFQNNNCMEKIIKNGTYSYSSKIFTTQDNIQNQLSKTESLLFELLLERKNSVVSYDEINEYFWKYDKNQSRDAIKAIVKEIRKKTNKDCITNVFGIGYKIEI
ncbi:NAD(P)H-flavin oxidoreductase [Malaciobacter molluscorum]|uniref:response regulator transcription factor n=1 Tax=Malaciobacter molluscorum TaxID=1032072 RepID=UPI00100ABE67|nr:response regulator [Malaciobacter molluscorum]RXJ97402.1 NAD(P)H-flavin oxidoreductase [Malaciobacter molluscorum]